MKQSITAIASRYSSQPSGLETGRLRVQIAKDHNSNDAHPAMRGCGEVKSNEDGSP